jgi:hypothetical protein
MPHRCLWLHRANEILAAHRGDIAGCGGGWILSVVTSGLIASVAVEIHGGDGGGPDVDVGRCNPDGLVGGGINSYRVGRIGCGLAGPVGSMLSKHLCQHRCNIVI